MRRRHLWLVSALIVAGVAMVDTGDPTTVEAVGSSVQGTVCVGSNLSDLDHLFDTEPAGVVGADYQRATELRDGRVFWTFQDGAIRTAPDRIEVIHNIAAIQDGPCFTFLYGGTRSAPRPFLFAGQTVPFQHWFWPLGAEVGLDGQLYVFVAEMVENGPTYLSQTEPVATRVAVVDLATSAVTSEVSPANDSAAMYGWSVTSDHAWSYLYAQCYRQFGYDIWDEVWAEIPAHDLTCANRVTVGRVPRGELLAAPEYWDGTRWQPDPNRAAPVVTTAGRVVNANQIRWTGGQFVSVNKVGDWWGDTIELSRSATATGPFVSFGQIVPATKCAECNTFFASWVPRAAGDRGPRTLAYGLSHNRWDGVVSAVYRPTFQAVAAPTFLPAGSVYRVPVPTEGFPILNVTTVRPERDGFVTMFPCDAQRPVASTLNYEAGEDTANVSLVRPTVGVDGAVVCLYSSAGADVVVDLSGSFVSGFEPEAVPVRLVDTRGGARLGAGEVLAVPLPSGVGDAGVAVNVTLVRPEVDRFATVFSCEGAGDVVVPVASNVNYRARENVANLALVGSASGSVCVFSSAGADVVVDLSGSFVSGFEPEAVPVRLIDSRRLP